jgi:protein associated with RNAse G/E
MTNKANVTVIKLNPQRIETWRYPGHILEYHENSILLEAFFNREDLPFYELVLRKNDRFIERYFADRWYNIFEIHDRDDGHIKGWYCNVTQPAEFSQGEIRYVDLALDVLAYPNGNYLVLDKDEFAALDLDRSTREQASQALEDLVALTEKGLLPEMTQLSNGAH